jgi:hypothetical protein
VVSKLDVGDFGKLKNLEEKESPNKLLLSTRPRKTELATTTPLPLLTSHEVDFGLQCLTLHSSGKDETMTNTFVA